MKDAAHLIRFFLGFFLFVGFCLVFDSLDGLEELVFGSQVKSEQDLERVGVQDINEGNPGWNVQINDISI